MNLRQRLDLELEEFLSLNQDYSFERMQRNHGHVETTEPGEDTADSPTQEKDS